MFSSTLYHSFYPVTYLPELTSCFIEVFFASSILHFLSFPLIRCFYTLLFSSSYLYTATTYSSSYLYTTSLHIVSYSSSVLLHFTTAAAPSVIHLRRASVAGRVSPSLAWRWPLQLLTHYLFSARPVMPSVPGLPSPCLLSWLPSFPPHPVKVYKVSTKFTEFHSDYMLQIL